MPLTQAQINALLTVGPRPLGGAIDSRLAMIQTPATAVEGGTPTYDQEHVFNNQGLVLLASAVRAATQTGSDRTNRNARGLVCVFDVTAVPGVDTVTPKIQGKDPASGKYYDILVAAAISAVSTVVLRIYPGLAAVGNLTANDVLPRDWRLVVTHSAASNFTYSAGGILLL